MVDPEELIWRCSAEKMALEISQNSQENTCARVSFLIKLQALGLYSTHDPNYSKLMTRLRLKLNHLNEHNFNHYFKDCVNPVNMEVGPVSYFFSALLLCNRYSKNTCLLNNSHLMETFWIILTSLRNIV